MSVCSATTPAILFSLCLGCGAIHTDRSERVLGSYHTYSGIDSLNTAVVEQHVMDLDKDGDRDTLALMRLVDLDGDPQLYNEVRVSYGNGEHVVLKNVAGSVVDRKAVLVAPNRVPSDLIYVPDMGAVNAVFCIWDHQYPDCSAGFAVFRIDADRSGLLYQGDLLVHRVALDPGGHVLRLTTSPPCDEGADSLIMRIAP